MDAGADGAGFTLAVTGPEAGAGWFAETIQAAKPPSKAAPVTPQNTFVRGLPVAGAGLEAGSIASSRRTPGATAGAEAGDSKLGRMPGGLTP